MASKISTFKKLISSIGQIHDNLSEEAGRSINISLTLRNWLIGLYISEYELSGADRAAYGENLLVELSKELKKLKVSSTGRRQLYNYLSFYRTYPQIMQTVPAQSQYLIPTSKKDTEKVRTASAQLEISPEKLIGNLSYSHLELLIAIEDANKRTFYEIESMRGDWSFRELKRQIDTLFYERSGLSEDKKKLAKLVKSGAEKTSTALTIRDPYVFEFLDIKSKEVMSESDLEDALLDKLQDLLLELGHGFCFEARQKRILIGAEHFFVDLVFYHRILKCHVLIDLKVDKFKHEYLGQLNTYVNWYQKNKMEKGDNPPVGLLLCTQTNYALMKYALSGMDNNLFVSKYKLELPNKEEIEKFLEEQMREEMPNNRE